MTRMSLAVPVIAMAAVLALAGCSTAGGSTSSSSTTLSPSDEMTGEITFWNYYGVSSSMHTSIIPAFEKAHPGVTVKDVQVPYAQMQQKLLTAAAGSALPDVMEYDVIWVPQLASLGVLEPLSSSMTDFQKIKEGMYPAAIGTGHYKDAYYSLPVDTNTPLPLVNGDALKDAGIATYPKTLAELKADAAKAAPGHYLIDIGAVAGWSILPFIWSNGGEMTDAAGTKATGYLNGPKSVEALQMLVDMYKAKELPSDTLGDPNFKGGTALGTGTVYSQMNGPYAVPGFNQSYPKMPLSVEPMFSGSGGSVSTVGGEDLSISQQSKNKALAAQFMRYLLTPEVQEKLAQTDGVISPEAALAGQMTAIHPYFAPFLEQLKVARPRLVDPQWLKIDNIFTVEVTKAFQGQETANQALDNAAAQIDTLLGQS